MHPHKSMLSRFSAVHYLVHKIILMANTALCQKNIDIFTQCMERVVISHINV
jgi:hypothetical protein